MAARYVAEDAPERSGANGRKIMKHRSRIYLAARYSRREELCRYREQIEAIERSDVSFKVVARWLDGNHQVDDRGLSVEGESSERERFARENVADVASAYMVISFTETPRSTSSRGGRHVEMGIALGMDKRVVVVGPRENVFHCLPQIEIFPTWEECLAMLKKEWTPKSEAIGGANGR